MNTEDVGKLSNWWNEHYSLIADFNLTEKEFLGPKENRKCRFCGRSEPEVKFRKIAHAIPESIENNNLFSNYECDVCNKEFGDTIESDFSNYLFPGRIASCILGKKGTITYKFNDNNRIDVQNGKWNITTDNTVKLIEEIDDHTLQFNIKRQPYIPINVYKALVKMALTVMPEEEIVNFEDTIKWLQNDKNSVEDCFGQTVISRFFPGIEKFPFIKASLFKRKNDTDITPAYQFLLCFSNYYFQIVVPCFKKDIHLDGKTFSFRVFPTPLDYLETQKSGGLLNFSSHTRICNEEIPIQMHFERKEMSINSGTES